MITLNYNGALPSYNRTTGDYSAILPPPPPYVSLATSSFAVGSINLGYYYLGAGPSMPSFLMKLTAEGLPIAGTISVSVSSNLESSSDSGLTWGTSAITVPYTGGGIDTLFIYTIRLKAGLPLNSYNETITVSTAGAPTNTINVSATVNTSLMNGVVLSYSFDYDLMDASGSNDGIGTDVDYDSGVVNQCVVFNGTSTYISSTNTFHFPLSGSALSMACWVKGLPITGEIQFICAIGSGIATGRRASMYADDSGLLHANFGNVDFQSTFNVLDGSWHLVGVTIPGGSTSVKLYCDNLSAQTGTLSSIPDILDLPLYLGVDNGYFQGIPDPSFFSGNMDIFTLWNREISAAEILDYYTGKQFPF